MIPDPARSVLRQRLNAWAREMEAQAATLRANDVVSGYECDLLTNRARALREALTYIRDEPDPPVSQGWRAIEEAFRAGYHCQWIRAEGRYIFDPLLKPGDPDGAFATWQRTQSPERSPMTPPVEGLRELIAKWRAEAATYVLGSDWRDKLEACADDLEALISRSGGSGPAHEAEETQ
jgi:hypothetical protein